MEKLNSDFINQLLKEVKKNKKYKTISDSIILTIINDYLRKNFQTKKIDKSTIKEIRKELHRLYSCYQTKKKNKRNFYLEELRQNPDNSEITTKLLSIAISTKERLEDYLKVYEEIFSITGNPNTIIDLGSGLNPFSFPLMNLKELNYYAYDIDESDISFLNEYFAIMKSKGLNGKAQILNVRDLEEISKLPSADMIFLFKLVDVLDMNNHKFSEELIKRLIQKTKFIVASFAIKTITRKQMNFPKRKWFELMLKRIGLKFQTIKTNNEIFYVISR